MNRAAAGKLNRFMLWIDAVGSYLVCAGERAVLGRPAACDEQGSAMADIPIFADLARQHATIIREGEMHLIESNRSSPDSVSVDGTPVQTVAALTDGSRLQLGEAVEMTFRLPNPLSASARLELTSDHSTEPRTTGVLLMADNCLLGPGSDNHIVCRDWTRRVALTSSDGELFVREVGTAASGQSDDPLMVDGKAINRKRVQLRNGSRISGYGITAFTVEGVG